VGWLCFGGRYAEKSGNEKRQGGNVIALRDIGRGLVAVFMLQPVLARGRAAKHIRRSYPPPPPPPGGSNVTIGDNGNWFINGVDTGIPANMGMPGTVRIYRVLDSGSEVVIGPIRVGLSETVRLIAVVEPANAATMLWRPHTGNITLDGLLPLSHTIGNSVDVYAHSQGWARIDVDAIAGGSSFNSRQIMIGVNTFDSEPPTPNPICHCDYDYDAVRRYFSPRIIDGRLQITTSPSQGIFVVPGSTLHNGMRMSIPSCYNGTSITGIGPGAFQGNHSFASVDIPNTIVTIGDNAFNNTRLDSTLVIPASVETIGVAAFANIQRLFNVVLNEGLLVIGTNAFLNSNLDSVRIPGTVTRVEAGAFMNNGINSVDLGNVGIIGNHAFRDNQLTSVSLPPSLTSIGTSAFHNNRIRGTVRIPPLVHTVGANAFRNDILTSLEGGNRIDELIFDNLTNGFNRVDTTIEMNAFYNNNIASIVFAEGVVSIGPSAFNNAIDDVTIKPREIPIPSTVHTIGNWAFQRNRISGVLTIPSSVTNLQDAAFIRNQIVEVHFEPGSSIPRLGWGVFGENRVAQVNIPPSVTHIADVAFSGGLLETISIGDHVDIVGGLSMGARTASFLAAYEYHGRAAGTYTWQSGTNWRFTPAPAP